MRFLAVSERGETWIAAVENEDEGWRCYAARDEAAWALLPGCGAVVLEDDPLGRRMADQLDRLPRPPYLVCAGWEHPLADCTLSLPQVHEMAEVIRALELGGYLPRAAQARLPRMTEAARAHLTALGLPDALRANAFLPQLAAACALHPALLEDLTGRAYALAGRLCGWSPSRVERSLRLAIEHTWARAPLSALEQGFGDPIDPERGKPTNREFLQGLARMLGNG